MVSKTKRLIFVSALALSIVGASMYSARDAFAQDSTVQSTLVEKIAQKFNLKTEDVKAVFDQSRQEHQAAMEAKYEQTLTDAVKAGKLTDTQKQSLITKHKEIATSRDAEREKFKTMSQVDRKQAMDQNRVDLDAWAKSNGVDVKYLMRGLGVRGRHMEFGSR